MKKYTLFFSSALLMSILLGYSLAVACPDIEFKNINWSSRRNSNYTPALYDMEYKPNFHENQSLPSFETLDIKSILEDTKTKLNELQSDAKNRIDLEIEKSITRADKIKKDHRLNPRSRKRKLRKIEKELAAEIGKIETDVKEQVKQIVAEQNQTTNTILDSLGHQ
ncbi:MAG: hypothetical protein GX992_10475 [Clostridium sp.]|nr:hypothetical protein [Clostridium sp.]